MSNRPAPFVFDKYGGSYQLRIRSASDLQALERLDEPFWVATSAPVDQLRTDPGLLRRLDRDGDGRIRSADIRAAARWMLRVLGRRDAVDARRATLRLDDLDTSHDEGLRLREAADHVLRNVGRTGEDELSLDAVRDRSAVVAKGAQNGDGVIPPSGAPDEALRAFIEDVMDTTGSVLDLNGEPGVNEELLDRFLGDTRALLDWRRERSAHDPGELFPLQERTAAAYALLQELRNPIAKYYDLCRVVGLNRVLGRETHQPQSPPEVFRDAGERERYLEEAPVARPRPEPVLPFEDEVNPIYVERLRQFRDTVAAPILGPDFSASRLSEDDWDRIQATFATYEQWLESKRGGDVERLGPDKLNAYLAGSLPARLRQLIENDRAVGPLAQGMQDLEYLILLQRWILDLCNNFVSFPYLYDPGRRATFEAGRLVMDGKIFNLNMRVDDVEGHSARAERSGIYLLYSEVTRGEPQQKFHIVTPVARVDLGNLGVDKRGVLFDLDGCEWDARVVKVVENVVSLKQALLAPFRRFGQFLKDAVGKISASAEQQFQARATGAVAGGAAAPAPPAAAPPRAASSSLRDVVLAGGLSVAALGTSFAYIGTTFDNGWVILRTLLVIAALVGVLLLAIAAFALLKLYARNLSSLLEASGWAINARMRLTMAVARIICIRPDRPHEGYVESSGDKARALAFLRRREPHHKPTNEE